MISLLQEENISFNNNSLSTELLRSVGVPKHTQHRPQEFRWGKNKRNVSVLEQEQGLWTRVFICCSLLRVRLYTPTDLNSSVGAKIKEMFCLGARTRFMKEGIYFVALAVLGKWYLMTSLWHHDDVITITFEFVFQQPQSAFMANGISTSVYVKAQHKATIYKILIM